MTYYKKYRFKLGLFDSKCSIPFSAKKKNTTPTEHGSVKKYVSQFARPHIPNIQRYTFCNKKNQQLFKESHLHSKQWESMENG